MTLRVLRFSQRWLWKARLSSMWRHVVCQNISTYGGNVLPPSSDLSTPWRWKVYLPPARQWIAPRHGVTSLKCPRCFTLLLHPNVLQENEMLRKTWIKRRWRKKGAQLALTLSYATGHSGLRLHFFLRNKCSFLMRTGPCIVVVTEE